MRRIFIIAALSAGTPPPAPEAPALEAPAAAEELGPYVLCDDSTKLRSEREQDGPRVYFCEG